MSITEPVLFSVYAVVGPGLFLLLIVGMVVSRVRFLKLRRSKAVLPREVPEVAVLIPAHNEGAGIEACLRSVLAMDYPRFSVLAIDDRSTDDTLARMRRIELEAAGRLRVLSLESKPADWLGKCHALHRGSQKVTAPWLLLIDSDVTVAPEALSRVMAQALARGVDAVSILTRQRGERFIERLLTPLACGAILAMYIASATNDDNRRRSAFANGQFFLIRREAYDRAGGHETVRAMPTEDVDLMRALKRTGSKCRLYAGDELAETRMYDTISRMFKGWGRIYSGASHRRPWRILIGMGVVLSGLSAFVVPGIGPDMAWRGAGAVHLMALLTVVGCIYRWSGNSPVYAVLFPVAAVFQLGFYCQALWWCLTNRMEWRGTAYAAPPSMAVSAPPDGGVDRD